MKFTAFLLTLSSVSTAWAAATSIAAANDGITIEVTHKVTCDRKTRKDDVISMTYALSLLDGTKVESSRSLQWFLLCFRTLLTDSGPWRDIYLYTGRR